MPIYINIHIFYINNSNNSLALNLTIWYISFLTWCSFKNKCNLGREGEGGAGFRVQGNNLR